MNIINDFLGSVILWIESKNLLEKIYFSPPLFLLVVIALILSLMKMGVQKFLFFLKLQIR